MPSSAVLVVVAALLAPLVAAPRAPAQVVDEATLRARAAPALEQEWLVGAVVGQLTPEGESVVGLGRFARDDGRVPDAHTVFEIGSVSKVFTALLFADAVARGEVALDTPVNALLPDDVRLVDHDAPITLLHLATHRSGLPRMPDNPERRGLTLTFDGYDEARLFDFLDGFEPRRAPGAEPEYSNLAVGLLGGLLARNAGTDYATLLHDRVLAPLGMHETAVRPGDALLARLAPPHRQDAEPAAPWDVPALEGAGSIRSTAHDMLRFGRFALGELEPAGSDTLEHALALTLVPREDSDAPGHRVGLGWHVNTELGIWWHNGQTDGYHAMFGVLPEEGVVLVGLANTANGVIQQLVDDLAAEWITGEPQALWLPSHGSVPADALPPLAGNYGHPALGVLGVTVEDDRVLAQLSLQPAFRVFPAGDRRWRYRVVDAEVVFDEPGEDGVVRGVTLFQNGAEIPFERIEEEAGDER